MGKYYKLREKVLAGSADSNIGFSELCQVFSRLGFENRIKGDHHLFTKAGVIEIINLQPKGKKAKPY